MTIAMNSRGLCNGSCSELVATMGLPTGNGILQSKQAIRVFLDRVNAALPINEPDQILLALVKGQVGAVCGKICPEGRGSAESGRCPPNVDVAAGSSDASSAAGSATDPNEPAPNGIRTDTGAPSAPLPGAMMIGGPRSEPEKISNAAPERIPQIENLFIHPLGGY